jgi:hypothetical protein
MLDVPRGQMPAVLLVTDSLACLLRIETLRYLPDALSFWALMLALRGMQNCQQTANKVCMPKCGWSAFANRLQQEGLRRELCHGCCL